MRTEPEYHLGMSAETETVAKKLFTTDEFDRILEAGIFPPDDRFELIRGEILQMPNPTTRHAGRVNKLNRLFTSRLGESVIVSVQNSMYVDKHSEPKPDIALLKPLELFFGPWAPEPEDVLLLVEISHTTVDYDSKVKVPLYAEAGVREYWILDIKQDALVVLTEPFEGEYRHQKLFQRGQSVCMQAFPAIPFSLDEILG